MAKTYTNGYAASLLFIAVVLALGAAVVIWERTRGSQAPMFGAMRS